MKHKRSLSENLSIGGFAQREHRGIRSIKRNYAIFSFIIIFVFESTVVFLNNTPPFLIIHWFLSFLIALAGSYAISRVENYYRNTTRSLSFHERQNKKIVTRKKCNKCNSFVPDVTICPNCNNDEFTIIGSVDEVQKIHESTVQISSSFLNRKNLFGFGIFFVLISVQLFISFNFGGIVNLPISMLMGLMIFIPSYYMFFKRYFVDTESITA
ncbi:MAG: hypothetical protein OES15_01065 [Nitrosopumilus sp.]|nr:hypothetical protein [Nitrosopumilus sp.]MDH3852875.1 hypothetical protein [Nitrosopumilus sp.]